MATKINNDFYDDLEEQWYHATDHPIALLRAENKTRIPWIEKKIESHFGNKGCTVLDIGCGAGFLCNALAKKGHEVTGIDLSHKSLEVAKKKDETQSVNYIVADGYNPPFDEGSFDVICAMDFLEHIEKPETVIKKAASLLKKDGLFFFHTFNRNLLSYLMIIKGVEWFVKNSPKDMHLYKLFIKPKELKEILNKNKLKTLEIVGFSPSINLSLLKMVITKNVPPSIQFKIHNSLTTGYLGFAKLV